MTTLIGGGGGGGGGVQGIIFKMSEVFLLTKSVSTLYANNNLLCFTMMIVHQTSLCTGNPGMREYPKYT